jgi:hypothetical protein
MTVPEIRPHGKQIALSMSAKMELFVCCHRYGNNLLQLQWKGLSTEAGTIEFFPKPFHE